MKIYCRRHLHVSASLSSSHRPGGFWTLPRCMYAALLTFAERDCNELVLPSTMMQHLRLSVQLLYNAGCNEAIDTSPCVSKQVRHRSGPGQPEIQKKKILEMKNVLSS